MPIEFVPELEKLDGMPAEYHGFYAEKDGKFRLRDDDPIVKAAAHTINGLNGALKNARKEADGHKAKVGDWKPLAAFGETSADITTNVLAKIAEHEATIAKNGSVDVEKIKKSVAESMKGEIDKREARIGGLSQTLHKHLVVGAATAALAKHEGDVELTLPHVLSRLKPVEDGDKYEVVVLDDAGEVQYSKINPGAKMSVEEYVGEMSKSDKYSRLFNSKAKGGGGANPKDQNRGLPPRTGAMSAVQKISAGLASRR